MLIKFVASPSHAPYNESRGELTGTNRVRTLTGKEIELDIDSDYKVRPFLTETNYKRSPAYHLRDRRPSSTVR